MLYALRLARSFMDDAELKEVRGRQRQGWGQGQGQGWGWGQGLG